MRRAHVALALSVATIVLSSQPVDALFKTKSRSWINAVAPSPDALESFHSTPVRREGSMPRRDCLGFIEKDIALIDPGSRAICDVREVGVWRRTVLEFESKDSGRVGMVAVRVKVVKSGASSDRGDDEVLVEIEGLTASFTVPKTKQTHCTKKKKWYGSAKTSCHDEWVPTPISAAALEEAMRRCDVDFSKLQLASGGSHDEL